MEKLKVIAELERICKGGVVRGDVGELYVKIKGVSCIMQYEDTPKNIDVLTIKGFRNKLKEEGFYGESLEVETKVYKNILEKFRKESYRIKRHDFFGPHLLRVVT